jgi:RNA polymerase sigma-70 factor (ECF subfamily)
MTEDEVSRAYTRFGPLVYRRCRRILRDEAAAEDAVQETFVRLWRFGDGFQAADSKLAWLYRVAERCCFDRLARRPAGREVELGDQDGAAPSALAALEDAEVVLRFLGRFDDRVKQVALLHYLDGQTLEEIAQQTGWTRQTVAKKLGQVQDRAQRWRRDLFGEEA